MNCRTNSQANCCTPRIRFRAPARCASTGTWANAISRRESATRERLQRLARLALEGAPLAFVFDRPRRQTALAEGIDRQHPAVLLTVGLHLPRLALQPGIDGDPAKFLPKLGSLARLALSAGVQKREYLRRLERGRPRPSADAPALTSGFLLDRACLLVAPVGLDRVVHSFINKGLSAGGAALDFGRQIVLRLRDVLRQDGRNAHLDTCLDGPSVSVSKSPRRLRGMAGLGGRGGPDRMGCDGLAQEPAALGWRTSQCRRTRHSGFVSAGGAYAVAGTVRRLAAHGLAANRRGASTPDSWRDSGTTTQLFLVGWADEGGGRTLRINTQEIN